MNDRERVKQARKLARETRFQKHDGDDKFHPVDRRLEVYLDAGKSHPADRYLHIKGRGAHDPEFVAGIKAIFGESRVKLYTAKVYMRGWIPAISVYVRYE